MTTERIEHDPDAPWQELAECRGMDPEFFFPARGEPTAQVKAVCRECPVRIECLTYALDNDEKFGIWGGRSERERRTLRKAYRAVNPRQPKPIDHGTAAGYDQHRRRGEQPCRACTEANTAATLENRARRRGQHEDAA